MQNREKQKSQIIIEAELLGHNKSSQVERFLSYAEKIKGNVRVKK